MKAFIKEVYGGPKILKLEDIEKPVVKSGHLLIKVMDNSVNAADWHFLRIKLHISQVYSYMDIPEAIRYIEKMHTSDKVVMEWNQ